MRGCLSTETRFAFYVCEVKQSPISVIPALGPAACGLFETARYREFSE